MGLFSLDEFNESVRKSWERYYAADLAGEPDKCYQVYYSDGEVIGIEPMQEPSKYKPIEMRQCMSCKGYFPLLELVICPDCLLEKRFR